MSDLVPYSGADKPQPRIVIQPSPDPNWRERETLREHVKHLAWLLDSAFVIPGTSFRIGIDPMLGLIPVLGDLIGLAISSYLIMLASRIGVPRVVLWRMTLNVGIDAALGAIPFAGDVFDAAWRANAKNAALLEQALVDPKAASRSSTWVLIGLTLLMLGITIGGILLTIWLVRILFGTAQ